MMAWSTLGAYEQSLEGCELARSLGLQGRGLGAFWDIENLTMFADYRVPVVFRQLDILEYSSKLGSQVTTSGTPLTISYPPHPCAESCSKLYA